MFKSFLLSCLLVVPTFIGYGFAQAPGTPVHSALIQGYVANSGPVQRTLPAAPPGVTDAKVQIDYGTTANLWLENTNSVPITIPISIRIPQVIDLGTLFPFGGYWWTDTNPFDTPRYQSIPTFAAFDGTLDYLGPSAWRSSRPRYNTSSYLGHGYEYTFSSHQFTQPITFTFEGTHTSTPIVLFPGIVWRIQAVYSALFRITYF